MRFPNVIYQNPRVLKWIGWLTLKIDVAVLELFQEMLVRQEQLQRPRVGPGDNWGPIDQTGVLAQYRPNIDPELYHYSQTLVPFSHRKWNRPTTQTSRLGDARRNGRSGEIDTARNGVNTEPPGDITQN